MSSTAPIPSRSSEHPNEYLEHIESFNQLWNLLKSIETNQDIETTPNGIHSLVVEREFERPEGIFVDRNEDITTLPNKIMLRWFEREGSRQIKMASTTQWPWGHEQTGQKLGLPGIALIDEFQSCPRLERFLSKDNRFPLEGYDLTEKDGEIAINTHGPHGEFDFESDGMPCGNGKPSIYLGEGRYYRFDGETGGRLKLQLLEGCLAQLAELLGEETELEASASLAAIQSRVRMRLHPSIEE